MNLDGAAVPSNVRTGVGGADVVLGDDLQQGVGVRGEPVQEPGGPPGRSSKRRKYVTPLSHPNREVRTAPRGVAAGSPSGR